MPKKKDWGTASRSSARQASKKLDEEPDGATTSANRVKQEEDVVPGTFPDDEHNIALPLDTTRGQRPNTTQPSPPPKEMADDEPPAWALPFIARLKPEEAKEKKRNNLPKDMAHPPNTVPLEALISSRQAMLHTRV
ncbi:hypothetical protein E4U51_006984 [Claviceps purpurea]|nr:hypothetical protein E4U51_006984 [Claviceps purpurea]